MPELVMVTTVGELFNSAVEVARKTSKDILQLADLDAKPLDPGETPDERRHKIAKQGKLLAEAFVAIDKIMMALEGDQNAKMEAFQKAKAAEADKNSN